MRKTAFVLVLVFAFAAIAAQVSYRPLPAPVRNQEFVPPGEEAFLAGVAARFQRLHETQAAAAGGARRAMHAKGVGCLRGTLVFDGRDSRYAQGVAATTAPYPVVARFSNGAGIPQPDGRRDLRGLALKLSGVEGERLTDVPELAGSREQDFLLTNAPYHHARDISELIDFLEASAQGDWHTGVFYAGHLRLFRTLIAQTSRKPASLLRESYWGRAAFRWGADQAVRFSVQPCDRVHPASPNLVPADSATRGDKRDPDYLAKDLQRRAAAQGACFAFLVQPQADPTHPAHLESIEDHARAWSTPATVIGRVEFPPQAVDESAACEALTFNPWNGLAAHRPLGNMNRARRHIYPVSQRYRGALAR